MIVGSKYPAVMKFTVEMYDVKTVTKAARHNIVNGGSLVDSTDRIAGCCTSLLYLLDYISLIAWSTPWSVWAFRGLTKACRLSLARQLLLLSE